MAGTTTVTVNASTFTSLTTLTARYISSGDRDLASIADLLGFSARSAFRAGFVANLVAAFLNGAPSNWRRRSALRARSPSSQSNCNGACPETFALWKPTVQRY
jgi:hypothetical protein